jgi:hypothetical protein
VGEDVEKFEGFIDDYWHIELIGINEAQGQKILDVASKLGLNYGGSLVDPADAMTMHLDACTAMSLYRGLGSLGKLSRHDARVLEGLRGSMGVDILAFNREALDDAPPDPEGSSYPPVKRPAWQQLDDSEHDALWDRFYEQFKFDRSGGLAEPVIKDPAPSITFDLNGLGVGAKRAAAIDAINAEALRCFVSALPDADNMFVLDWQHPAYRLDAQAEVLDDTPRDPINGYPTVYPNGDYYAFTTADLTEGTFGHPWESSLCVFGNRLVAALGASLATWLPIMRSTTNL